MAEQIHHLAERNGVAEIGGAHRIPKNKCGEVRFSFLTACSRIFGGF